MWTGYPTVLVRGCSFGFCGYYTNVVSMDLCYAQKLSTWIPFVLTFRSCQQGFSLCYHSEVVYIDSTVDVI